MVLDTARKTLLKMDADKLAPAVKIVKTSQTSYLNDVGSASEPLGQDLIQTVGNACNEAYATLTAGGCITILQVVKDKTMLSVEMADFNRDVTRGTADRFFPRFLNKKITDGLKMKLSFCCQSLARQQISTGQCSNPKDHARL